MAAPSTRHIEPLLPTGVPLAPQHALPVRLRIGKRGEGPPILITQRPLDTVTAVVNLQTLTATVGNSVSMQTDVARFWIPLQPLLLKISPGHPHSPPVFDTQQLTEPRIVSYSTLTATSVGNAASIVNSIGKIFTATVGNSASLAAAKTILQALTATVGNAASIIKSVGKIVTAIVGNLASIARSVGKILTATVGNSASLTVLKTILQSMTASVGNAASMVRSTGLHLTATSGLLGTLNRGLRLTLTATVGTAASLVAHLRTGAAAAPQIIHLIGGGIAKRISGNIYKRL